MRCRRHCVGWGYHVPRSMSKCWTRGAPASSALDTRSRWFESRRGEARKVRVVRVKLRHCPRSMTTRTSPRSNLVSGPNRRDAVAVRVEVDALLVGEPSFSRQNKNRPNPLRVSTKSSPITARVLVRDRLRRLQAAAAIAVEAGLVDGTAAGIVRNRASDNQRDHRSLRSSSWLIQISSPTKIPGSSPSKYSPTSCISSDLT